MKTPKRVNRAWVATMAGVVLLAGLAISARAETAAPAAGQPVQVDPYKGKLINRDAPVANSANSAIPAPKPTSDFDAAHVLLALAVVLGLIFLLRWCGRKMFAGAAAQKSTKSIAVLSRMVIAPKQQLLLVKIGRRLVLVGDAGSQLNPLCQITDPDEVAALIGELKAEKTTSVKTMFSSLFSKARESYPPAQHADVPEPANSADPTPGGEAGDEAGPDDSSLTGVRTELSGLAAKIRGMSRQLGRH